VLAGAVLQQTFMIEYIIGNKQCTNCQRREAKDTWTAVVQMRQKVPHKRTFLWIEQLILKHNAHADSVNIIEQPDGLDFFFDQRSHAEKLVGFLQGVCPMRYKHSKQLVSEDTHTGKGKNKFTYSVEVLPICKEDCLWIPRATAAKLGHISQLALCCKVSNVIHVLDPRTLQVGEVQPMAFWKLPFRSAMTRKELVEFVVLDVELSYDANAKTRHGTARAASRESWALADITVAKVADFGSNDRQMVATSHLGNLLKPGDHVWGYCVSASQLSLEADIDAQTLPEVLLVKKSYKGRAKASRRRTWKLQQLAKEEEPGVMRGRKMVTDEHDDDYEEFLQELEEDVTMRQQINLYKDQHAMAAITAQQAKAASEPARRALPAGLAEDDESDGDDDDFPDVELDELLDELTLGADDDEAAADVLPPPPGVAPAPVSFAPGLAPSVAPEIEEPVPFAMPGGEGAKFYF